MRNILNLPVEVLSMVFEVGFGDGDLAFTRAVSLTCRSWYQVAIDLPRLWSHISVDLDTTFERMNLWMQRSRSHLLDIDFSVPPLGVGDPRPGLDPRRAKHKCIEMGMLLISQARRWRRLHADSWWEPEESEGGDPKAGWERVNTEVQMNMQPVELEELFISWAGAQKGRSPEWGFPKLRKVTLERAIGHWAPYYLVPTLTFLSLGYVDELQVDTLLEALHRAPLLQEIRLDEVVCDTPATSGGGYTPVELPNLFTLSVSGGAQIHHFICSLILPKLRTLVLVDIADDLSPIFQHLSNSTSSIEHLTTGMWDYEDADDSQRALLGLLIKQRLLDSLWIQDATLSDQFILALHPAPLPNDTIAPMLKKLRIPVETVTQNLLPAFLRSRSVPGTNISRLRHLILLGDVAGNISEEISPFVDVLEVESAVVESGSDMDDEGA